MESTWYTVAHALNHLLNSYLMISPMMYHKGWVDLGDVRTYALAVTYNQEWIRESTQQHTQSIVLRCARVASLPRVTTRCYVHTVVCEYDCLPSNE